MACQVFFQCKDLVQLMFSTAGQFALCWDNQLISTTLKLIDKASNISIRPFFYPSKAVIFFARSSQEQRFSEIIMRKLVASNPWPVLFMNAQQPEIKRDK